jgi:hypothetical protein
MNLTIKRTIINLTLLVLALSNCVLAQNTNCTSALTQNAVLFNNLNNELIPVFVFTYLSPWKMVRGSDTPEFVLYEDGTVIYAKYTEKGNPNSGIYLTAQLSPEEISQIMKKINPDRFSSYNERYTPDFNAGVSSDLPKRLLILRQPDGKYKSVSLYGGFRGKQYEKGFSVENVPQDLGELIDFVTSFDTAKSKGWYAEYYEVIIEPSDDESEKIVKWSKKLPDLTDTKTIKHKKFGMYSLFISKAQRAEFYKVWYKYNRKSSDESAVLINNQKWDLEVRIPFPSEIVWLGNFRN